MVDVRVGQHHGINAVGVEAESTVDQFRFLAATLEQATIEEDARIIEIKEMLRASDGVGTAEKVPFHAGCS